MNCPHVFIRDVKSIFNQGQIALLPVTSKSQLPVLELDVNPVTLRLLPCFLPRWRGKGRSVQRSQKIFNKHKRGKENYTATSNKRWASIHGSDGSRLLFTSHAFQSVLPTQELLPSPSTAKLSLILAGARERDCPACTERGAIDGCGTALTAYTRLFNYVRKAWIFLQVSLLALS